MDDHEFCLRCGRRLKNPVARERGYGNICYKKMVVEQGTKLFIQLDRTAISTGNNWVTKNIFGKIVS